MPRPPLEGVRILAVSQFGAGPFGTQHLADLGADIIKSEDPGVGGDVACSVPAFAGEADSPYVQPLNRGKRSITLNLRHPDPEGHPWVQQHHHRAPAVARGDRVRWWTRAAPPAQRESAVTTLFVATAAWRIVEHAMQVLGEVRIAREALKEMDQ